jgi:hypothetical protein
VCADAASEATDWIRWLARGNGDGSGDFLSSVRVAIEGEDLSEGVDDGESKGEATPLPFDIITALGFIRTEVALLGGTDLASPPSLDTGICTTIGLGDGAPCPNRFASSDASDGTIGELVCGECDALLPTDLTLTIEGLKAETATALPPVS